MRRQLTLAIGAATLAAFTLAPGVQAYLTFGADSDRGVIPLRWDRPVRYFITNRSVNGVTPQQLQAAVASAFQAWTSVPTASLAAEFGGFTTAEPLSEDGVTVIGFQSQPDEDRTLGATKHRLDAHTGQIIEADIFLNAIFDWSVTTSGQSGRYDVESIAAHEIGHLLGLGHSALGETELGTNGRRVLGKRAVMFPIAYPPGNVEDRTLEADDVAGITDIYSTTAANQNLGAISGRVTLDGHGVFGAHIEAFNPATGLIVGGYSLDAAGHFVISGLAPGMYVVRVEPLDDGDLDSFFGDDADVELDFKVTYHPSLVAVPAGGTSGDISIKVTGK